MTLNIVPARSKYLLGFFTRRVLQHPECWFCGKSPRKACLTCDQHYLRESDAANALTAALSSNYIHAENLPHCYSCHCPYLTNTSTINVCDSCLLQAVSEQDEQPNG